MTDEFLGERRRALEESFFAKRNYELLTQLRQQLEVEKRRAALQAASGIDDDTVLDELVSLDIGSETFAALSVVPLVQVAWADRVVQSRERAAILRAATEQGMHEGDPAYSLLEQWLHDPPPDELLKAWQDYVHALARKLSPEALESLKRDVLGRAREVAEAAGGYVGTAPVSEAEERVLEKLERSF